jgi:protein-glutamine gamma-glutamyltransferase
MTRPAAARRHRPATAATATATALLVIAGAAAWSPLPGGSPVRVAPLAAVASVAAVTAALAAGWLSGRLAGGLLAVWLPAGLLAAGVPAGQLLPPAWPWLLAPLAGGATRLITFPSGPVADQPWPLAAWLLATAAVWVTGAALAASAAASARRRTISFGVLAAPWIAAVTVGAMVAHQGERAAWQGAAVLLAGLLWVGGRRIALRRALALGVAVALASVGITQAIGPRTRWFTAASPSGAVVFRALQIEPTYGPLRGRRSGAAMLQISAAQPALWRMRVLSLFFGPGWRTGYPPSQLPQSAARPVQVTVVVRALGNDLLVAPGRIDVVHAHGQATPEPGEARRLTPPPRQGATYQVRASVVRATSQQLRAAPAPTDPRLRFYTRLTPGYGAHSVQVPLFGQPPDPHVIAALDRTPYRPVVALARHLAADARTQWEVVTRVQRYLLDGDRFRYTTDPPEPGLSPLVDFLLRDHAGHCQHFAGAAALLLRLAGVPTRVAVGFATGIPTGDGRFNVRDVDAHAWIEVYFQGYGWVAFNPTPPAAQASIPRQLDPLAPAPATTAGSHGARSGPVLFGWLLLGALVLGLATAGLWAMRRRGRRRPAQLGQLLEDLVGRTGGRLQPSTTLAELAIELARLVGPNTAALAAHAEEARFAPDPTVLTPHPRIQLTRALASDLGPIRTLILLVASIAARGPRQPPPRTVPR